MSAVTHPSWCQPDRCTADPEAITKPDFHPGDGGTHRSGAVVIPLPDAINGTPHREITASLSRAVAPWPCVTYVRLGFGQATIAVPVGTATDVVEQLSDLLRTEANAEEEIR